MANPKEKYSQDKYQKDKYQKDSYQKDSQVAAVKMPPHSIEAEQSVLGGLMLDNNAWDKVAEKVVEQDFYLRSHRYIFAAMSKIAKRIHQLI